VIDPIRKILLFNDVQFCIVNNGNRNLRNLKMKRTAKAHGAGSAKEG